MSHLIKWFRNPCKFCLGCSVGCFREMRKGK